MIFFWRQVLSKIQVGLDPVMRRGDKREENEGQGRVKANGRERRKRVKRESVTRESVTRENDKGEENE